MCLCLLVLEVISSQFGVVDLEQDVGVADGGSVDLKRETTLSQSHGSMCSYTTLTFCSCFRLDNTSSLQLRLVSFHY